MILLPKKIFAMQEATLHWHSNKSAIRKTVDCTVGIRKVYEAIQHPIQGIEDFVVTFRETDLIQS